MDVTRRLRAIEKIIEQNEFVGYALQAYAKFSCDCEIQEIDTRPWQKRIDALRDKIFEKAKQK